MGYLIGWNRDTGEIIKARCSGDAVIGYADNQDNANWQIAQRCRFLDSFIPAEEKPEEEHTSFWDKKIKVDPITGAIFTVFSELFFGLLKCFLFFLREYPKALEEV